MLQNAAELLAGLHPRLDLDIRALLLEIARDVTNLSATYHPLGFLHVDLTPLVRVGSDQLRLHVWGENRQAPIDEFGSIHDHAWNLSSAVLVGQLVDRRLAVEPSPTAAYRMIKVSYQGQNTPVERGPIDGRWAIQSERRTIVCSPEIYRFSSGEFHATEIPERPVVTLVRASATARSSAYILSDRSLEVNAGAAPRAAVPDAAVTRLAQTLAEIAAAI